jgi:hypothetical protein
MSRSAELFPLTAFMLQQLFLLNQMNFSTKVLLKMEIESFIVLYIPLPKIISFIPAAV